MSIQRIKETLHLRIEEADERLLKMMYAMSMAYHLSSEKDNAKPYESKQAMSHSSFIDELKNASQSIENGNFITLEDLEKEMSQW